MKIKQGDFVKWRDISFTIPENYKGVALSNEINGLVHVAVFERFHGSSYDKNIVPTYAVRSKALTVFRKTGRNIFDEHRKEN